MRTFIRFTIAVLFALAGLSDGHAQKEIVDIGKTNLHLATNRIILRLGQPYVVATWPASTKYTQYNLYRKTSPLEEYPLTPLNGKTPIAVMEDCDEIKTWIPEDGPDWKTIGYVIGGEDDPYNPCAIAEIPRSSTQFERLQMLARGHWKIAVISGQGFQDTTVKMGTTYYYELRAIDPFQRQEITLGSNAIVAGSPVQLPETANVDARADDSKVLVLFDDVENAAGYVVYRATDHAFTSPQRVNEAVVPAKFTHDLRGVTITVSSGFVDYTIWDDYGNPTPRDVNGVDVSGPFNDQTYYYKVAALDMLGYEGVLSSSMAMAMPVDLTPPMTPHEVQINANDTLNQLEIRWTKVEYNVEGHVEDSIQGYRVFRYDIPDSTASVVAVGALIPPAPAGHEFISVNDSDPILRPLYGEKTFWYRIKSIDGNGNESSLSSAIAGYLNDVTPPAAPKNVKAEGFENFIRVTWNPNSEPDLDGYLIYRSLCEYGEWTCVSEERQKRVEKDRQKECPETFKLLGYVSSDEAKAFIENGEQPQFDDGTVDAASPICYAYLVKAIDRTQNQNDSMPPDLTKEIIACQRIRDRTPPEPAIVSSLLARDSANSIEWIGAPVQDIAAYHVYRSEEENGTYKWVGGMTVERPPATPTDLAAPYTPPATVGCNEIALVPMEYMSTGTLLDKQIEPKVIYWYKVLGVDLNGNESKVEDAVPVSTFTFSTNRPSPPVIQSVSVQSPTCALSVQWTPAYDTSNQRGFIVFRSNTSSGQFLQISELVTDDTFVDARVVRGIEYWYQVVEIDREGNLSPLSSAKNGKVSP